VWSMPRAPPLDSWRRYKDREERCQSGPKGYWPVRGHLCEPPRAVARPASATCTMTIAPVVAPTTVAPANDVRAANLIADNPANDGADWPGNDGANAGADADALYFASLGCKRCRT
jgi:hypothetical protein